MATTCPHASWDPLGVQTENRMSSHDVVCFHTMAGYFRQVDIDFHANGYGGLESHFGVRADGFAKQWQDLDFRADANLDGNPYCISIETEDHGPEFAPWANGSDVPEWTDEQLAKLIRIADWLCTKYNIPRSLIPDTKPGRRGIGYHRQGIDPWRVSGGVMWSRAGGKVCPGDRRIHQLNTIIIPALQGVNDLDAAEHKALMDTNHRSAQMYKALRGDDDADQALVNGIRNHFRTVLDEEAGQSGSALRVAIGDISLDRSKRALNEHPVAKAEVVS